MPRFSMLHSLRRICGNTLFRKPFVKLACVCTLCPTLSYANMPVIDITAIGNMIMQYQQMIQEAVKYEKELSKLGVDTGRVGGILAQLDSLSDSILSSLDSAQNIPGTLENVAGMIKDDCEFLMKDKQFKDVNDRLAQKNIKDIDNIQDEQKEAAKCLLTINDVTEMGKLAKSYVEDARESLKKGDMEAYNKKMEAMKYLQNTRQSIQKSDMRAKKEAWDKFYTTFESEANAESNPNTQKNINGRLKTLLEQAKKSTTQTDAQNFGNQVMLELLNITKLNYEMMMKFNNTMLALQDKGESFDKAERQKLEQDSEKLAKIKKETSIFAEGSPFEEFKGEFKKDALGLPILDFGSSK